MVKSFTNNPTKPFPYSSVVKSLTLLLFIFKKSKAIIRKSILVPVNVTSTFKLSKSLLVGLVLLLIGVGSVNATKGVASSSGKWSSKSTWGGSSIPTSSDNVTINSGITVTVDISTAACLSLQIGSGSNNGARKLIFNSGSQLTVFGTTQLGGGSSNIYGTLDMSLGGTLICTALSSTSTLDSFLEGTGTVQLNATNTLASTDTGAEFTAFHNLIISAGTTTLARATTISGNLTINSGATLATDIYQITGNGTGTFAMAAGANITLGRVGQWSNISFPTNFIANNIILDPASTVVFQAMDGQTVSQVPTYGNLTISGTGNSKSAADNITINGNLTIDANTTFSLAWTLTSMTVAKQLVNNGTLKFENYPAKNVTVTGNLSGTGTIDMTQIAHTLNLNGQNNSVASLTTDGNNSTVNYGYTGAGSQQVFASPNYRNLTISGGSAKALQGAATVNNLLTMTSGILSTTSTNSLRIANTATTAIAGASTTSFIDGPVIWSLPSGLGSGSTYNFPVGNGSTYLPFVLVNPTTSGTATAQVQATVGTSGGTANVDGTLISKSNTEYWNLVTSANFTNSSVTITRPTAITSNDAIGGSTASAGTYTALGGTAGSNTVSNSNTIGLNRYFAFAQAQKTITTGTIVGSPLCAGSTVSVPFTITGTYTSGNIFTAQLSSSSGSFATPVSIGTLTSTAAGTISTTIPAGTLAGNGYRIRVISSTPSVIGANNGSDLTINTIPTAPTTTNGQICIGSNATLSASGAVTDNVYRWYDAASGGNLLKTSTDYNDNTYTTAVLSVTTSFWVSIMNVGGCESSRTQVSATFPAVSTDDQNAAGTDSWIGHVYDDTNSGVAYNGSFTKYYGHYTEPETFDESWGGIDYNCFDIISNSTTRSMYTDYFSVRYRMNSTKKGLYTVNLGSDDGSRLTIDGVELYDDWGGHAFNAHNSVLINLTGNSSLVYDFFENGGGNRIVFQNLTQVLANNLTTNTTQTIYVGNTGTAISGDSYGTLPTNITLSGTTGYQWTYSTTSGGTKTVISGATGATYTPNTTTAPFNVPGTYYLYRNAVLSSTNNVSPSTYVATNVSNAAILTVLAIPVITTSTSTLTGFSYPVGYGPSSQIKSFTVSGVNLTTNISVLPTDSFEISLTSGASFIPQNLITLLVNNGTVSSTTIYIRMKAGLDLGNISVNYITCTSDNAVTKNIACSGTVTTAPVVTVTPVVLTGFSYMYTNGPSTQQSFNVSGTSLLGNVIVTPSADFEISTTSNGTFQSTPITISASGTLSSTSIYVRMKTGAGVGSLLENIVVSSINTTPINVSCAGIVSQAPTILNSISALSTFIYTAGSGPSGEQTFTVSGTNLTDNLVVTPPANFEISKTTGSGFQSTAITLNQTGGSVNSTIYVRLKASLTAGDYNLASIGLTSTGAIPKSVSCSGSVVSTATILVSKATITGFGYQAAAGGPSSEQMFTVSGSSLTADITVAPPASYYDISLTSGSGFQSNAITLTRSSSRVNPTIIYIRLKSGLAAGDYTGTILASAGTPTKSVSLVGKVFASPLITADGGGFYCLGSTINLTSTGADIQNRYWEGPNSFYSVLQNLQLTTNATVALSGTYKVTGNVTVGGNLITNGDFESGNISFGSNYGYAIPATSALYNEGLYTVVANPHSVHSDFTANGDHSSGSGNQMVINGSPKAGVVVWSQSVPVIPGASYQFTYWLQSVTSTNPSQLQLYVNGVAAGPVNTASTSIPLWTQFLYNASAGTNTILNLELINQNTVTGGNDFALDDIVFQQILSATASTDVTVASSVPVSVSVAASANPVVQGVTVTYTSTPTNGGSTPVYAWYVNDVLVAGATGSTYSYVPSNNDKIKCILTSSISCVTNNPATSNSVTMTVNVGTNYWIGTTSTDWGTASNWTSGKVPLAGDNVVYATATNNNGSPALRDLFVDGNRTIGSLINATNKRLVIPTTKSLTVNNTITTNGADSLIHIVSNSTDANGSLIFHNSSSSPVHATVEMYSKAFYNEAGATNQKYHWQYFGIPISSVTSSPTFDGSYVRRWEESGDSITNHWISLNNSSVLLPFYGYEITQKSATTIVFQGQLVNSDFDAGQLSVTSTALFPGQHVYANPYTAAIDIRQLNFGTQTEATVYLYNTGTFDQWTQNGGVSTPGNNAGQYTAIPKSTAGDLLIPRQIPSMQAILVKAISNSSLATFGITYNSVIMSNTDQQRVKALNDSTLSDKVCTMIDVAGTHYSDRMWLFTEPGCTRNFDNGWDGAKMTGIALTPQIFAIGADGNYQVNAVDDINNTILGFQAGEDTEYTLTFTHQNLTSKYVGVFLVDLVENKTVDITESGSTYSFVAESTPTSVKRFMIATRNIEKDASDKNTQIKVFGSGNTVFVQNLGNLNGEMNIYDMTGRCIKKANFGPYGVTAITVGTIPGAYTANATTSNERVSKRIILGK